MPRTQAVDSYTDVSKRKIYQSEIMNLSIKNLTRNLQTKLKEVFIY